MTSSDCLECHENPSNVIAPAGSGYLPDMHHLMVDTPIGRYSASPFPESSPDGKHQCVTCHRTGWFPDPSLPDGGGYRFVRDPAQAGFRTCLACHIPDTNRIPQAELASNQNNRDTASQISTSSLAAPTISELSEASIVAGSESPLIILGSGFMGNTAGENLPAAGSSWVSLTNHEDTVTDIYPDHMSPTHMEITIPDSLEPGNYKVVVNNQENLSETTLSSTPVNLSIKPRLAIEMISCDFNTITVTGSGFSSHYLNAEYSGTSIHAGTDGEKCKISSWSDGEITATCPSGIGRQVHVTTLYDSTVADTSCSTTPPKWWSIWSWWSSWSWSRR